MTRAEPHEPAHAESRRRLRRVEITEDRCVVCGEWVARKTKRSRVTCGPSCCQQLYRLRKRGLKPEYGVEE